MGNQALTSFTTTFVYVSKLTGITKDYKNCILEVHAADQQGRLVGPKPNFQIPLLTSAQGLVLQQEQPFNIIKDSTATHVKVVLSAKGTFSNTEIGSAFFSIGGFKQDVMSPFDLNLMSKQNQVVGKISMKMYIPGELYEKKLLYKHAVYYQKNLCQIHFTKRSTITLRFGFDTQIFYNDMLSLIFKVIEFVNDKRKIFEAYDVSSLFSEDTPMMTITIRFTDEFIKEAQDNIDPNEVDNNKPLEKLVIPCTISHQNFPTQIDPTGLQAKFFYQRNNTQVYSNISYNLDFHSQNELNALNFIDQNKDSIDLISKDKGMRFVTSNNSSSLYPFVSCYIVWYHLKDNSKQLDNYQIGEQPQQQQQQQQQQTQTQQGVKL
eukprot:gene3327-5766_t